MPHSSLVPCWHTRGDILRVYFPPGSKNLPRSFAPKSFAPRALEFWLRSGSHGAVAREFFTFFLVGVEVCIYVAVCLWVFSRFCGSFVCCSCLNTVETFAAMLRNTTERERERQTHTHRVLQSTWSFQQLLLKNSRKSCYSSAPFC